MARGMLAVDAFDGVGEEPWGRRKRSAPIKKNATFRILEYLEKPLALMAFESGRPKSDIICEALEAYLIENSYMSARK